MGPAFDSRLTHAYLVSLKTVDIFFSTLANALELPQFFFLCCLSFLCNTAPRTKHAGFRLVILRVS